MAQPGNLSAAAAGAAFTPADLTRCQDFKILRNGNRNLRQPVDQAMRRFQVGVEASQLNGF
jgi:hypothetical protein